VLYVYAFVEPPAAIPDTVGIESAPLESEPIAGLAAVVSRHASASLDTSETAVLAHARVVEALTVANAAVLPARFGGAYANASALTEALTPRAAELAAALDRVRGCIELGVRILVPAAEPAAVSSGAAYMRARLEQRRGMEQLADELHAPLAARAREATRTVGATERLLLSAAYLVPKPELEAFREAVEGVQAAHPELGIVCTGPWPPYSFATAETESR
jgi:Gas vesicle synthesis protein GvpL/GvpF